MGRNNGRRRREGEGKKGIRKEGGRGEEGEGGREEGGRVEGRKGGWFGEWEEERGTEGGKT